MTNDNTVSVQWAPSGNLLDGIPGQLLRLLASADGTTHGYAGGPGRSMIFGSEHGDVSVEPRQWVTRHTDGSIEVTDEKP